VGGKAEHDEHTTSLVSLSNNYIHTYLKIISRTDLLHFRAVLSALGQVSSTRADLIISHDPVILNLQIQVVL